MAQLVVITNPMKSQVVILTVFMYQQYLFQGHTMLCMHGTRMIGDPLQTKTAAAEVSRGSVARVRVDVAQPWHVYSGDAMPWLCGELG